MRLQTDGWPPQRLKPNAHARREAARLGPLRVSKFGFAAGRQLITALSEGRLGEAGMRGCFLRAKSANPSPTAARSPLCRRGDRGLLSTDFSPSDQDVQTAASRLRRGLDSAEYACDDYHVEM